LHGKSSYSTAVLHNQCLQSLLVLRSGIALSSAGVTYIPVLLLLLLLLLQIGMKAVRGQEDALNVCAAGTLSAALLGAACELLRHHSQRAVQGAVHITCMWAAAANAWFLCSM
jgi:hypothetical protein